MLNTSLKDWLATNAGVSSCFSPTGIQYTDPDGVSRVGSTGDVINAFIVAHLIGKDNAIIIAGTNYTQLKAINKNDDIGINDVSFVYNNDGSPTSESTYCVGAPPTPTPPTPTPTPGNYALQFDGIRNYVEIPYDSKFDILPGEDFSFSFRLKTTCNELQRDIISKKATSGFWIIRLGYFAPDGAIWAQFHDQVSAKSAASHSGSAIVNDGKRHDITVEYIASSGTVKILIDGVDTTAVRYTCPNINIVGDFPLRVAQGQLSGGYLEAIIDNLSFYKRILSLAEHESLRYDKPVSTSYLVGEWKLNEGSGTKTIDTSGRGNDGTLLPSGQEPTWVLSDWTLPIPPPPAERAGIFEFKAPPSGDPTVTLDLSGLRMRQSGDGHFEMNDIKITNTSNYPVHLAIRIQLFKGEIAACRDSGFVFDGMDKTTSLNARVKKLEVGETAEYDADFYQPLNILGVHTVCMLIHGAWTNADIDDEIKDVPG